MVEKIEQSDHLERMYLLSCGWHFSTNSDKKLVQVRWSQVGGPRKWIVAIPKDSTLSLGNAVFVNVSSCTEGLVDRTAPKPSRHRTERNISAKCEQNARSFIDLELSCSLPSAGQPPPQGEYHECNQCSRQAPDCVAEDRGENQLRA